MKTCGNDEDVRVMTKTPADTLEVPLPDELENEAGEVIWEEYALI